MSHYYVQVSTRVTAMVRVEAADEETARTEALKAAPYYENSRAHYDEWEVSSDPEEVP